MKRRYLSLTFFYASIRLSRKSLTPEHKASRATWNWSNLWYEPIFIPLYIVTFTVTSCGMIVFATLEHGIKMYYVTGVQTHTDKWRLRIHTNHYITRATASVSGISVRRRVAKMCLSRILVFDSQKCPWDHEGFAVLASHGSVSLEFEYKSECVLSGIDLFKMYF